MQNQKQATKPAANVKAPAAKKEKQAPAAKAETKAAPFFATLYGMMLAGSLGKAAQAFYKRADAYHARQATTFPRQRTDHDRANLDGAGIREVIKQATAGVLPAGSAQGQAVYDLMRIKADHKDGPAILADLAKAGVK